MPDTTEYPAVAAGSESAATTAQNAESTKTSPRAAPVSEYSTPDSNDFFDAVHRQTLALLQCQEDALKYIVGRTQPWVDCNNAWVDTSTDLSRETLDKSRASLLMAIEDTGKLMRLWTDIGFQAAAPFVGRTHA